MLYLNTKLLFDLTITEHGTRMMHAAAPRVENTVLRGRSHGATWEEPRTLTPAISSLQNRQMHISNSLMVERVEVRG